MPAYKAAFYLIVIVTCLVLMTGCETPAGRVQIQEVYIPVPAAREVPAVLLEPVSADRPHFVSPADPAATSALTAEGERALKGLLLALQGRIEAWKAWATE
ncbi:MAG: hypothetical protein P1U84_05300 [Parvibaculaceae bacterium]|nr:hypothetical protein [Parvibaculaceae bacterium]